VSPQSEIPQSRIQYNGHKNNANHYPCVLERIPVGAPSEMILCDQQRYKRVYFQDDDDERNEMNMQREIQEETGCQRYHANGPSDALSRIQIPYDDQHRQSQKALQKMLAGYMVINHIVKLWQMEK